jgi:cytosine/adenosine deaminase-related metal-dependent hydrolase
MLLASGCDCAGGGDDDGDGDADADADGDGDGDGDGDADGDADTGPPVTDCDAGLEPPAEGTCEVADGDDNLLLLGTVLTSDEVFLGGAVLVDAAGAITCVGCDCADEPEAAGATRVTCAAGVISPGLIDAHNHVEYDYNDPVGHGTERFEHRHDWRTGDRGHTEVDYGGSGSDQEATWAEIRMALAGTTSYVGTGEIAGLVRNLSTDQGGLDQGEVDFDTFPLNDIRGETQESGCQYPDLPSDTVLEASAYLPHVAEGIGLLARNEFACLTSDEGGGRDVLAPNSAFIHAIGLNAFDAAILAEGSGQMVWSPRSNIDLYGNTAAVTMYARQGTRMALGTDWTISGSMNILRELDCADRFNRDHLDGFFGDWDLWEMATENGARVSSTNDVIGALEVGRIADIAVFDGSSGATFRAVVEAGVEDVVLVLRGGLPIAGDAALVQAIPGGDGCEVLPYDVCGTEKAVCLEDVGATFADLEAENGGSYPLFFCDEPAGEPSCEPFRLDEYDGVGPDDVDGDGVEDGQDLCPSVFNPIRPLDDGAQADFDGDGLGDVCDPCPTALAERDCPAIDAGDLDGDGIGAEDNCPVVANEDQADADDDGHGDLCDACADVPNPGPAACPATIYDVKLGVYGEGTRVALSDVVVTAVSGNTFFLQVPEADQDADLGVEHSGIFCFVPNANPDDVPIPARGDRISLEGQVSSFHDALQLSFIGSLDNHASGQALPSPVVVTPDEVGGGGDRAAALEGVLVRAEGTVTAVDADGNATLDDVLALGDTIYLPQPTPEVDDGLEVTGLLRLYNSDYALHPRDEDDVRLLLEGDPQLESFLPARCFVDEGAVDVVPVPDLRVTVDRPAPAGGTVVTLEADEPARLDVPASVTIPEGATSAQVRVSGLTGGADPVTVTATLGGDSLDAEVVVVAPGSDPVVAALEPDPADVAVGQSLTFTVTLSQPAGAGGDDVAVSLAPGTHASLDDGPTVTVAQGALSATFGVTGTSGGDEVVTATLNGGDVTAGLTVNAGVEIGGWELVQTNSARTFTFPAGTMVSPGDYVIVARLGDVVGVAQTQADFEAFWGVTLGVNVQFFSDDGTWPNMNGGETFELLDDVGATVDGPTIALTELRSYLRVSPDDLADDVASWTEVPSDPESNANPGSGGVASDAWSGLYISEFADGTGNGNFAFEFVELYYE